MLSLQDSIELRWQGWVSARINAGAGLEGLNALLQLRLLPAALDLSAVRLPGCRVQAIVEEVLPPCSHVAPLRVNHPASAQHLLIILHAVQLFIAASDSGKICH